ncbi:Macrolide export ATP-binding/permease protein MacB [Collimonas arenae]|uniref:Pyoverdine export ATP-binding/permease protein PvdT n=1 Tax=Collimonas arenae TaxID=279058 RepID=A0A0A1F7X8_9BURK|nr:MacB family efflux pump subunit [Collimonas arenae]AIY40626.1 Macrolide export ATP-binding/permease protein MacB [Collimonas arenae]
MMPALLELNGLYRRFPSGEETVTVLNNINLKINAGEMVALVGPSGSGKSTLMNILGCLDRPSSGSYLVAGQATGEMQPDALAQLRREHFGFIFQRYHLLPDLDALSNVEIPAIYAGKPAAVRRQRSLDLLARLGLAKRSHHRPSQLSGGQQQRVSIARSLMNGGQVILADEPTGALDSHSGQEVIKILQELHAEGHTVIIVTHDMHVAEYAQRIIEISDGEIIADRLRSDSSTEVSTSDSAPAAASAISTISPPQITLAPESSWRATAASLLEACRMASLAMRSHRLRSFLTMLGIIIGIASVVSVVALGEGSRRQILKDISFLGTNTITIYPGKGWGDEKAAAVRSLMSADADVLAQQSYADSATPGVTTSATIRYRNISASATLQGVGDQHFRVHGIELAEGMSFTPASVKHQMQEVVIDHNTRQKLFGKTDNPIGQVLMLGNIPSRIIGVAKKEKNSFGGGGGSLTLWVPYTTALTRIIGQSYLQSISVRVSDSASPAAAERSIAKLLTQRHGSKDFFIQNSDSIRKAIESTTAVMTLLVSTIALISLVVGGIGVMNIMLVSVTERIQEIGVRMAVGARQGDIMRQFLIEAVLVCLLGGILGIALALGIGALFSSIVGADGSFQMHYSLTSIVVACTCSTLIGIIFGFLPARNAARLDPVEALARE